MYYLLMVVIALVCYYKKEQKYSGIVILGVLFFLSAFRGDNVGIDTLNAMDNIRYDLEFSWDRSMSMEILTNFIYLLIFKGAPPRIIIYFYSAVLFVSLFFISRRWKINLSTIMLFFLLCGPYIYSFNIARQWAAMSVIVLGLSYVFEEEKKKSYLYFIFVLLAASIHFSSLVFVVLYGFRYLRITPQIGIMLMAISLVLAITQLLPLNSLLSRISVGSYLDSYADNLQEYHARSFMGYIANILEIGIYIYIVSKNKLENKYIVILSISASLYILAQTLESVVHRSFMVFMFTTIIAVSAYFSRKDYNKLIFAGFLMYCLYSFYNGIMDDYYLMF